MIFRRKYYIQSILQIYRVFAHKFIYDETKEEEEEGVKKQQILF